MKLHYIIKLHYMNIVNDLNLRVSTHEDPYNLFDAIALTSRRGIDLSCI